MSVVTNLILSISVHDGSYERDGERVFLRGLAAVKAWCETPRDPEVRDRDQLNWPPAPIDTVSGGTKHMEVECWCWGANYLTLTDFLEAVRTAPWRSPELVQVFVHERIDARFAVYNLTRDRAWVTWR